MILDPFSGGQSAIPSTRDAMLYDRIMREFGEVQGWRSTFASQWEEVAELVLPDYRNTFYYGTYNFPGQKKTDRQIDSNGQLALARFGAICDSLLTPRNQMWHGLTTTNASLNKDRQVRLWFEQATHKLFQHRYRPTANFASQNQQNYISGGAFGNGFMFIDELDARYGRGLRYKAVPLGEIFWRENHQGIIDGFIRWLRLTPRQAMQKWGPDKFPEVMRAALNLGSEQVFDFLHWVGPNDEYDPKRMDFRGKPWKSVYLSIPGHCIMQEGGYRRFPGAPLRYMQAPGEVYGRGPAMQVLPALKTLNAEKRVFLKQGHRAADPVLLTTDDGMIGFQLRPGAINKGGMSSEGRPLVGVLPSGEIQISKEMMAEEKGLINDAFLVTLFQIMTETPQMTATEVIERTNEKGILIAPTMGRLMSEYLGPIIDRELDVLMYLRELPPMPPQLAEAKGEYEVIYSSPLARAMKAGEASGFLRTLSTVNEVVQVTQDTTLYDRFNFDKSLQGIARIEGVPESWMASDQEMEQKAQSRLAKQKAELQIQAAPAAAGMMKAQAAQKKAGMQPQGAPQQQQATNVNVSAMAPPAGTMPQQPQGPGQ